MKAERNPAPSNAGTTVEYQVRFASGPKGKKRVRVGSEVVPVAKAAPTPPVVPLPCPSAPVALPPRPLAIPAEAPPSAAQPAPAPSVPKITLLLVLGHHFERLVRDGAVKDYAEIARRTGLTRARLSQIMNLLALAPHIQGAILHLQVTGGTDPLHERSLRAVVMEPDWRRQRLATPIKR